MLSVWVETVSNSTNLELFKIGDQNILDAQRTKKKVSDFFGNKTPFQPNLAPLRRQNHETRPRTHYRHAARWRLRIDYRFVTGLIAINRTSLA